MKITRRDVLIGGAASLAAVSACARAQQSKEIVIGALYPMSGASAVGGIDARHAMETAVDVINTSMDLDLPLAKSAGLAGLGGAKVTVVYADHQSDPQKGRAEAERLITQQRVAALIGLPEQRRGERQPDGGTLCHPNHGGRSVSPSLNRRGLKFFFRAAAHDEMFSKVMFDFFDVLRKKGTKIETLSLIHEDTIFGTFVGAGRGGLLFLLLTDLIVVQYEPFTARHLGALHKPD